MKKRGSIEPHSVGLFLNEFSQLVINVGTPMIARVIRTSAKVNAFLRILSQVPTCVALSARVNALRLSLREGRMSDVVITSLVQFDNLAIATLHSQLLCACVSFLFHLFSPSFVCTTLP